MKTASDSSIDKSPVASRPEFVAHPSIGGNCHWRSRPTDGNHWSRNCQWIWNGHWRCRRPVLPRNIFFFLGNFPARSTIFFSVPISLKKLLLVFRKQFISDTFKTHTRNIRPTDHSTDRIEDQETRHKNCPTNWHLLIIILYYYRMAKKN